MIFLALIIFMIAWAIQSILWLPKTFRIYPISVKMPLKLDKNSIEPVDQSGHYRHFDNTNCSVACSCDTFPYICIFNFFHQCFII